MTITLLLFLFFFVGTTQAQIAGTIGNAVTPTTYREIEMATITRYASNPIIPVPGGSSWNEDMSAFDQCVFVDPTDSTKLIMFATGMAAPTPSGAQTIGRFTSTVADPYAWVETGQVLAGSGGSNWDAFNARLNPGGCRYVSGTFYLYYSGAQEAFTTQSIGIATSTDNGLTFTRHGGNPILTPTGQGRDDGTHVSEPIVFEEGGSCTMLYSYRDAPTVILPGYRYATSSDCITSWAKGGAGDVYTCPTGLYCEGGQLLKFGATYVLLHTYGNDSTNWKIFLASSSSLTSGWAASSKNPILSPTLSVGSWERYHVSTAHLIKINNAWRLYYQGAGDHAQPYSSNTWPLGVADLSAGSMRIGN